MYRRLRLDIWSVNYKRVQRIWREEGLQQPLLLRRQRSGYRSGKRELLRAEYSHYVWTIDFQFQQTMVFALRDYPAVDRDLTTHHLSKELNHLRGQVTC